MEDQCKYEKTIGTIETSIDYMQSAISEIKENSKALLEKLDGKDGLISQVRSNKESLSRAWWFIGMIAVAIIGGSFGLYFWVFKHLPMTT